MQSLSMMEQQPGSAKLSHLGWVVAALVSLLWAMQSLSYHLPAHLQRLHWNTFEKGNHTMDNYAMRRAAELARERTNTDYLTSQAAAIQHLEWHPEDWGTAQLWYLMGPFQNCVGLKRFGYALDGGYVTTAMYPLKQPDVPGICVSNCMLVLSPAIMIELGSRGDITFEQAILAEYPHCSMHTFDPTLDAQTVQRVSGLPGITFHPQGLTSQAKLQDDGRDFTTITENFTTIERSMIDLGVRWLDVLKMDIEGEEWVVMLEMLESGIDMPFTQILIEVHMGWGVPEGVNLPQLLQRFFMGMNKAGYRMFAAEANVLTNNECWEYGFVKVDKDGHMIKK